MSIENKNAVKKQPPQFQLLKWIGNKQRIAGQIIQYFPVKYNTFYEPFFGSGAIMATLCPKKGVGSDIYSPLIALWEALKEDPEKLIDWYRERIDRIKVSDKVTVYNQIRESFNRYNNPADFIFLIRVCYGGVIRFRKADGWMSTPCGVHNPITTETFQKRVYEWYNRLKHVEFRQCDYRVIFDQARKGDLIYCDPPYPNSQNILYGAHSFKLTELFDCIESAKQKGVRVALSLNGFSKSGSYLQAISATSDLFKEDISLPLGNSMLKRFHMEGLNLEKERIIKDRLLLTY
ncbi:MULTISPECIES: Dam family site-specific DNA-(adenine-N6)-methyltransferase [unclassified Flavobacterium]|uniref:DNA adenine methylase n=1 Tax=unclassified Flavobacterium TaxID=196869 RepID=UPI0026354310|nr:Dam family site-specific DNA-(adenine-N6)-methyltransferase [Flavobacterium sp.]